jgi:hypothetical protein
MNFIGRHFFPVSMKDIYSAALHFSFEGTKIAKIDAKKAQETEKSIAERTSYWNQAEFPSKGSSSCIQIGWRCQVIRRLPDPQHLCPDGLAA